jgi:hypothetical protein
MLTEKVLDPQAPICGEERARVPTRVPAVPAAVDQRELEAL